MGKVSFTRGSQDFVMSDMIQIKTEVFNFLDEVLNKLESYTFNKYYLRNKPALGQQLPQMIQ